MITCTITEATVGLGALRRIAAANTLPEKGAWRVARLINKVKKVVQEFNEIQIELFEAAGGVRTQDGVELPELVRDEDEPESIWLERVTARRTLLSNLQKEIAAEKKKDIEIEYDPIPTSLFVTTPKDPKDEAKFSANDFADAAPFLAEA